METTWFWLRSRYSSRRNSRACSSIFGRAAPDFAREQVHLQIGEGELRHDARGARAADERMQPGLQLGKGKGLGQVIVAAALQALDPIVERALGAEDEDGQLAALGAPALDDAQAVELRQHEIDHGGVVGIFRAEIMAFLALGADIDHVARFTQALGNKSGDLGIVFQQKNFHSGIGRD